MECQCSWDKGNHVGGTFGALMYNNVLIAEERADSWISNAIANKSLGPDWLTQPAVHFSNLGTHVHILRRSHDLSSQHPPQISD